MSEVSAIDQARNALFLNTAEGVYLTRLGRNLGVPRPEPDPNNDELFRCIVEVLAWQPNTILATLYNLLDCVLGTPESIEAAGSRSWAVYEVVPNEFVLEVPLALTSAGPENGAYLHGFLGYATTVGGPPSDTFTTPGDITAAGDLTAGTITAYILEAGVYVAHVISSWSYSAGSGLSTVVVAAVTIPASVGARFYVDVPGDGVTSYAGDFLAPDAAEVADQASPATATHDVRPYLLGQGNLDTVIYYLTTLVRAAGVQLRVERI